MYPLMLLPYTPMAMEMAGGSCGRWVQDPQAEKEQYLAIVSFLRERGYQLRTLWSFSLKPTEYEGRTSTTTSSGSGRAPGAW